MLLDIHTHKEVPQPEALADIRVTDSRGTIPVLIPDQLYSAGIHPWDISTCDIPEALECMKDIAGNKSVAAIGECGVDILQGGALYLQLNIFRQHVEISETLRKPMIIHDVKADDIICGLRRDLAPVMPWAIHGFRGKPAAAAALVRSGCYICFGEKFNPDTLRSVPVDRILAETDESTLSISEIIDNMSLARGEELKDVIEANSKKFCNFGKYVDG